MKLLIVNAGSSSLRVALYDVAESVPTKIDARRYETREQDSELALFSFIEENRDNEIGVIAHRVVHGGADLVKPCVITREVKQKIEQLAPLAPLHNPFAVRLIDALERRYRNNVKQLAVFDTAFYHDLPDVARVYALPVDLTQRHQLLRYGFHGLAHEYMWQRWHELSASETGRIITLQLGSGCSITATQNGKPVDTSMGFSPLEGLVMGTRSGDVDPGLVLFLQRELGYSVTQLEQLLNNESGLLGMSGESADVRDLAASPSQNAKLALEIFCYRARKYIGSYLAAMGGADAIVFGGGIGENMPQVRASILENLDWCGINVDQASNISITGRDGCISAPRSKLAVWVVRVDEERIIAEQTKDILSGNPLLQGG